MMDRNDPGSVLDTLLIGYRVTARPSFHAAPRVDHFELKQAAIECADRCAAQGWVRIGVVEVLEECGEQYTEPVGWVRKEERDD